MVDKVLKTIRTGEIKIYAYPESRDEYEAIKTEILETGKGYVFSGFCKIIEAEEGSPITFVNVFAPQAFGLRCISE